MTLLRPSSSQLTTHLGVKGTVTVFLELRGGRSIAKLVDRLSQINDVSAVNAGEAQIDDVSAVNAGEAGLVR